MTMKMNGNLQLMGWGGRGHLQDETETTEKGDVKESMGVLLAVIHSTGDMDPERSISCSQIGTPMKR